MNRWVGANSMVFRIALTAACRRYCAVFALVPMVVGCFHKSADLGNDLEYRPTYAEQAPPTSSADAAVPSDRPWALVANEGRILEFTVNQGQAFWMALPEAVEPWKSRQVMKRCEVTGCKGSLKELGAWPPWNGEDVVFPGMTPVALDETSLFPHPESVWTASMCSKADCSEPRLLAGLEAQPYDLIPPEIVASAGGSWLVRTRYELSLCDAASCAETMVRLLPNPMPAAPDLLGTNATQFRYALDADHVYFSLDVGIYRTRLDRTGEVEPILADEQNIGQLAVHGGDLYWTESVVFGTVKTCPASGCVREPSVLMGGLNRPESLVVDDQSIYVMEPCSSSADLLHDRILRCPIGGCEVPTVLVENAGGMSNLFLDGEQLYFAGSRGCGCLNDHGVNQCPDMVTAFGPDPHIQLDYFIATVPK